MLRLWEWIEAQLDRKSVLDWRPYMAWTLAFRAIILVRSLLVFAWTGDGKKAEEATERGVNIMFRRMVACEIERKVKQMERSKSGMLVPDWTKADEERFDPKDMDPKNPAYRRFRVMGPRDYVKLRRRLQR